MVKNTIVELQEQIVEIKEQIKVVDKDILTEYRPEIQRMKNNLQKVLVEQKTENFKLVKEIAILEKEKLDLQNVVYTCLGKLHKLEREIGVKSKAYTYLFDQSIIDNEIGNKFIIDKEDI
jgi:hypothetical protein